MVGGPGTRSYAGEQLADEVDLGGGVVDAEGEPDRAEQAHLVEEGAGAVHAAAHRHAVPVQVRPDVVRVDAVDHERDDAAGVGGRVTDHPHPVDRGEHVDGVPDQRPVVPADRVPAEVAQVVQGGGQPARAGPVRRAGLPPGRPVEVADRLVGRDALHGAAAHLVRGQPGEQVPAAVQHADAHRPVRLVPGEAVEVGVEVAHVDRPVRYGLGAVDHHQRAGPAGGGGHLPYRVDGAEHVRDVGDRHQRGVRAERGGEPVGPDPPVRSGRHHCERGARTVAEPAPRQQVAVVLHAGHHDPPARPGHPLPGGVRDQVDRGGGAGGEEHLLRLRRADRPRDALAGLLVPLGGLQAEPVVAAPDVAVRPGVVVGHRVQDDAGLLRGGGVVQVGDEVAGPAGQQGEVVPYRPGQRLRIVSHRVRHAGSCRLTAGRRCRRTRRAGSPPRRARTPSGARATEGGPVVPVGPQCSGGAARARRAGRRRAPTNAEASSE